jgi:hypothetical protein
MQPAHFSQGPERDRQAAGAIARANELRNGGRIAVFSRSKPQIELRRRAMAGEANMPSCRSYCPPDAMPGTYTYGRPAGSPTQLRGSLGGEVRTRELPGSLLSLGRCL